MMFKLKNFTAFVADLPAGKDIELLIEDQPGFRRESIGDTEFSMSAFMRNGITKRYVTPLEGGFMVEVLTAHRELNNKKSY